MRVLRTCSVTVLLNVAWGQRNWIGETSSPSAHRGAFVRPSMSFVDADRAKITSVRRQFRSSKTRLVMAATASSSPPLPSTSPTAEDTPLDCSSLEFSSVEEHHQHLYGQSRLPSGFSVGSEGLTFTPEEVPTQAQMNVTAIVMDEPSDRWAAVFTRNMFPGAPVVVGRERLAAEGGAIQGIIINNKVSNVCPGGDSAGKGSAGVADSESICRSMAEEFGFEGGAGAVLPCSTGVIGWRLPVSSICGKLASVKASLQSESLFPAAKSIMTTDRYPKLRGTKVGSNGGRLVAIAKGAGMIEPNMATMLVYILTDLQIPRETLREMLSAKCDSTFNCVSVDSDTSTSDTVALLSSGKVPLGPGDLEDFEEKLEAVCAGLAEDVVRNGEGTSHVMKVRVTGAPTHELARRLGKAVVNSPLFKSAVAGNDPNVGRLLAVVGRVLGTDSPATDASKTRISLGGRVVFEDNAFAITPELEDDLFCLFKQAEMSSGGEHLPYPPHFRAVPVEIDLGAGEGTCTVLGSDLTEEYVHVNADYRS